MERLEDEAETASAEGVEIELCQRFPLEEDLARGRSVKTAEEVEQRRLAATAGACDRDGLARVDRQGNPLERPDVAIKVGLGQPLGTDQYRSIGHCRSASVGSSNEARTAGYKPPSKLRPTPIARPIRRT